jgi:alpha-beta hydrolase superfamily lysophospholipase
MTRVGKALLRTVEWLGVILVTVLLVRAFDARRLPDLKSWHRVVPQKDLLAAELNDRLTLADYIAREAEVFREVQERVVLRIPPEDRTKGNRYFADSPVNPSRFTPDWNRTFEMVPPEIRGGALLIHGVTDGPYSMRRMAELLRDKGFYVLCPRLPGHGTVPGALTRARWEDWLAATKVGARLVRAKIGKGKPFMLFGYSGGGALAVLYSLEALSHTTLPAADRIVLLSPMVGIVPFPAVAKVVSLLAFVPSFEKSRWIDVLPEYNPYKYNSFPVYAARQTIDLTSLLQAKVQEAADSGRIGQLPPILAFQSLADSTVSTPAVVDRLYDRLSANGSELVLFDQNRTNTYRPFLKPPDDDLIRRVSAAGSRRYRFTLITNATPDTSDVVARSYPPAGGQPREEALGLAWPPQVFSLSHIAVPFSPDDPLYGLAPDRTVDYGVRLGVIAPRGESSGLAVPIEGFMRLKSNPFFPYVERRIREWVGPAK